MELFHDTVESRLPKEGMMEGKKIENTKDWQYMSVNFEHQILFHDTRNQFLTVSAGMGHHIAFKFYHKISKLNN